MKKEKTYSSPRWNQPPSVTVTGHTKITKEEEEKYDKIFKEHLKRIGVTK